MELGERKASTFIHPPTQFPGFQGCILVKNFAKDCVVLKEKKTF